MALFKFQQSLRDYELVLKVVPNDPDARAKFAECDKIVKRIRFEKAIAVEEKPTVPLCQTLKETMEAIGEISGRK